ncbi:MAG: TetR family transcriptional regulator [Firmicutes bacterium]|jgi:AcrR family transcriptional regulator|nr:TetR family transcriptional regulator [Bacillota bacterium]
MPKIVDYEAQKHIIAEATRRLIRQGGLRKATVRNIAQEAGMSVGALRHCFPSQEDLIQYAMNLIVDQVTIRINDLAASIEQQQFTQDTAVNIFYQLASFDEEQKKEMEVWLSFCVEALYKPALKPLNDKMYDSIHAVVYQVLMFMKKSGLVRKEIDLDNEADMLHVLIDGLALHRVIRPEKRSETQMKEILRKRLRDLA